METKMYELVTSYKTNKENREAVLYSAVGGGISLESAQLYQKEEFDFTNPPKSSVDSKSESSLDNLDP